MNYLKCRPLRDISEGSQRKFNVTPWAEGKWSMSKHILQDVDVFIRLRYYKSCFIFWANALTILLQFKCMISTTLRNYYKNEPWISDMLWYLLASKLNILKHSRITFNWVVDIHSDKELVIAHTQEIEWTNLVGESGNRTHDLRICTPMLYRLSYLVDDPFFHGLLSTTSWTASSLVGWPLSEAYPILRQHGIFWTRAAVTINHSGRKSVESRVCNVQT